MATYRFGKWTSWNNYDYFAIEKKGFFGWNEVKTWNLGYDVGYKKLYLKQFEEQQKQLMMESVDRLVKAGNTVI